MSAREEPAAGPMPRAIGTKIVAIPATSSPISHDHTQIFLPAKMAALDMGGAAGFSSSFAVFEVDKICADNGNHHGAQQQRFHLQSLVNKPVHIP